jgi:hypothetical protein
VVDLRAMAAEGMGAPRVGLRSGDFLRLRTVVGRRGLVPGRGGRSFRAHLGAAGEPPHLRAGLVGRLDQHPLLDLGGQISGPWRGLVVQDTGFVEVDVALLQGDLVAGSAWRPPHHGRDLGVEELFTLTRDRVLGEHTQKLRLVIEDLFLVISERIENLNCFHAPILF